MANLNADSPLSRRIVRSFLQFLSSVELHSGVDAEALDVAKDCLSEVFKIDNSSHGALSSSDSLVKIFGSLGPDNGDDNVRCPDQLSPSLERDPEDVSKSSQDLHDATRDKVLHSLARDELFGTFFSSLEKANYFRRLPDGNDDQVQLDMAAKSFHTAMEEMEASGCHTFDGKTLAETFKSQGNAVMQSKVYSEAIDLYTFAIALSENNAVYYCNRAAAYTQVQDYTRAVQDCLRSIQINPNYSKAYSRLGFAYYAQGKYKDAIDHGFRRALQLDPGNESLKENIRVAKQKLIAEQQRSKCSQGSTSSSHQHGGGGVRRSNSEFETPFVSVPMTGNNLQVDLNSMFTNMTGNAFQGEAFENANVRDRSADDARNGSNPSMGAGGGWGSANLNSGDVFSDAMRSVMGMFPAAAAAAAFHPNEQQDDPSRHAK